MSPSRDIRRWTTSRSRRVTSRKVAVSLAVGLSGLIPAEAAAQWSGDVALGVRTYPREPSDAPAAGREASVSLRATRSFSWSDGSQFLTVSPLLRLDPESVSRSRIDFLDLTWEKIWTRWEVAAGLRQVDWGVTESGSVVDVVNQLDFSDDAPSPTPMGQPMVNVRFFPSTGLFEAFLLPFFRERRSAGRGGAIWSPLPLADAEFEHSWGRHHPDWALRWSQMIGDFNVAVAHFGGTNRQPRFEVTSDPSGEAESLTPHYDQIDQTSLTAQWTHDAWLVKLDAVRRASQVESFVALVGGIEFAFATYLSVFAEYLHDGRGSGATTSMEHDVFAGTRLLTQDWTISSRVFVDRRNSNLVLSTTASRRIGDTAAAELDGRWFRGDSSEEPSRANRLDSYLALKLTYFF